MNPFQYANDLMKKKEYDGDCIRERKDYKQFLYALGLDQCISVYI